MPKTLDETPSPERCNEVLDWAITNNGLKNDAALARALEVAPPVISKVRHGRLPIGSTLIVKLHEMTDVSVRDIKRKLGLRCLPALRYSAIQ